MISSEETASLGSVLVIGGCGFLGHHIVRQLQTSYTCTISVLDLRTTLNRQPNVTYHNCDITSASSVLTVFRTSKPDIIIHVASPPLNSPSPASTALYQKVNITGTQTLLQCAADLGTVKAFIYTSSASVIHDTIHSLINASETYPVLRSPAQIEPYADSKAAAETLVLAANRQHGSMLTCALRPAGIFGEGDTQMVPQYLEAYQKGLTRFQLGDNTNLFDFTYVGNVAHAHLLAAVALLKTHSASTAPLDHERIDGEAFFITNDSPIYFWDFPRLIWSLAGDTTTPAQVWTLGKGFGLGLATIVEWMFWLGTGGKRSPSLTRQVVKYSTMTRYYSCDKAKRRLGYVPRWGLEEGVERTMGWFRVRGGKVREGVEGKVGKEGMEKEIR